MQDKRINSGSGKPISLVLLAYRKYKYQCHDLGLTWGKLIAPLERAF